MELEKGPKMSKRLKEMQRGKTDGIQVSLHIIFIREAYKFALFDPFPAHFRTRSTV